MQQRYRDEIRGQAARAVQLQPTSCMVPKLEKIVLNMGVGEAAGDQKSSMPPWPS